jgi:hypothetical protein
MTRSTIANLTSSRAAITTPATIRSRSRSKSKRTARYSSESGEEDELLNGIDVFQRAAAEEQLRDNALVEERTSSTTPAAVALEAEEELDGSTDEEEAAGEDLLDTEYGESAAGVKTTVVRKMRGRMTGLHYNTWWRNTSDTSLMKTHTRSLASMLTFATEL